MTVGVAIYRTLQKQKIKELKDYSFFAGHSLGEYTSLICSNSLTLRDGAKILKERGKSMQEAVPVNVGAMAAVLGAEINLINEVINTINCERSMFQVAANPITIKINENKLMMRIVIFFRFKSFSKRTNMRLTALPANNLTIITKAIKIAV